MRGANAGGRAQNARINGPLWLLPPLPEHDDPAAQVLQPPTQELDHRFGGNVVLGVGQPVKTQAA